MLDKKIAIMQPYWFPYIGYFQLLSEADLFVVYNDVQFIERGWINRNKFLINREAKLLTLPLVKASASKKINEIDVDISNKQLKKILNSIKQNYSKAPYFEEIFDILNSSIFKAKDYKIDSVCVNSLNLLKIYLGLKTKIIFSSDLDYNNSGGSVEKINEIAQISDSKTILFPSGSRRLYSDEDFPSFNTFSIIPRQIIYDQHQNKFISGLSFLDVLMFNSKNEIKNILKQFSLTKLNQ